MTVLKATLDDRPAIVGMLRDAHESAGVFPFAFSAPHAYELASRHIVERDCLALVSEHRGVLLACVREHPFGRVLYASETVWWIDPGARGGPAAVRMLREYEAWARRRGCVFIGMAALATFPGAGKLYERAGYKPTETHYMKVL